MGDVIKFPTEQKPALALVPNIAVTNKFIIDGNEYIVDSVSRPVWLTEEWHVNTLEGPTYVTGLQYWAPMTVWGPEEFADAIQAEFPLEQMSLEVLDKNGVIQEWWEFQDVYLSTKTNDEEFIIYFREALSTSSAPVI